MYRIGQRAKSKKGRIVWSIVSLLLVVGLGVVGFEFRDALHQAATIHQSAAAITKVDTDSNSATKHYDETVFSVDIPSDWKPAAREENPYNIYRWQSGSASNRLLEVYVDTIPQNYAINRMVAVQDEGDHVGLIGTASDNCSDFTKDAPTIGEAGTHAKWEGIDFLCDLANYERNVLGTGSADGLNTVTLKGRTQGSHEFFFSYTDHNINPDYSTLYAILQSFHVN